MKPETASNPNPVDHGEVIPQARRKMSWAWLFPLLAAAATVWLFYSNWRASGPEIEVVFDSAPGIQAGKTSLLYRGMKAGNITGMHLDSKFEKVVVVIRLKAFASALAREGTAFWIDQPVVELGQTSGLDALIQGNSIKARSGTGPPTYHFIGQPRPPLTSLESPALVLRLHAEEVPFVDRGSPLFHRGVIVGQVEDKGFDPDGRPYLRVVVDSDYVGTVRANSRFWPVPGSSLKVGRNGVKIDMMGLKTILLGGLEFDVFETPGEMVHDEASFFLYADKNTARAIGPPVIISFRSALGLEAGTTEVRYLGLTVGLVKSLAPNNAEHLVEAEVRFRPGFEFLATTGTAFTLIRPRIALNGISGLETLVTGVYIDSTPGPGSEPATRFAGRTYGEDGSLTSEAEASSTTITLHGKNIPPLGQGAPVIYRGLVAGQVTETFLGPNKTPNLKVVIRPEFAEALSAKSRFWPVPPASIEVGSGTLKLDIAGVEALMQGALAFDEFGGPNQADAEDSRYQLFTSKAAAQATSDPIRVSFENGQGLVAGQTQVRHLGLPVGLIDTLETKNDRVEAEIRFNAGCESLLRKGTVFAIVRLKVSLDGVTGLETALSGVYIECVPDGGSTPTREFTGVSMAEATFREIAQQGLEIVVTTPQTNISEGAPVSYRGLTVGKIGRKVLASDGRLVGLRAIIDRPYAGLIRENTKFWNPGGLQISMGFFSFKVQSPWLESLGGRGIAFATPEDLGPRVKSGHEFELNAKPRREWLRWSPELSAQE